MSRPVEITRPTTTDPNWTIIVRTRAGRTWRLVDPSLRGAVRLFREYRRAKCWDTPPRHPSD